MMSRKNTFFFVMYGLIMSLFIGIVSFVFLLLQGGLTEILWETIPNELVLNRWYFLVMCLVGGLAVGLVRKKWGNLPVTAHRTMTQLKQHRTLDYRLIWHSLGIALIILSFGAGVGPEAALLSGIISLSVWQSDKLRYYYFNQKQLARLTKKERLLRMMNPRDYLQKYDPVLAPNKGKLLAKKRLFNTLFIINGTAAFSLLMKVTSQPSFVSKMGESAFEWQDVWLILPLLLIGMFFSRLYDKASHQLEYGLHRLLPSVIIRALFGSIVIFGVSQLYPNLLFSGQTSMSLLASIGRKETVATLLLLAMIKLLFLQICLHTGWVGGDIFPVVFSSMIIGFAVSGLLPQFDALFIVAVTGASVAISVLKSPILVGLFMMLFFPLNLAPVIGLTALSYLAVDKIIK